jgi:hypothetical protein
MLLFHDPWLDLPDEGGNGIADRLGPRFADPKKGELSAPPCYAGQSKKHLLRLQAKATDFKMTRKKGA